MSDQPEALRLADALDNAPYSCGCTNEAAAELRRLHAECDALRYLLDRAADMLHECGLRDEIYAALKEANHE